MGVKSMELDPGDEIVSTSVVHEGTQVLTVSENGYGKRTPVEEYRVQSRGGKGIKAMQLTDKTGLLAALMLVREEEDVMMISDDGTIIRTAVADISTQSRSTQGVRMMRLAGDSRVVAVTATERVEETPEAEAIEQAHAQASEALAEGAVPADEAPDADLGYQGDEEARHRPPARPRRSGRRRQRYAGRRHLTSNIKGFPLFAGALFCYRAASCPAKKLP